MLLKNVQTQPENVDKQTLAGKSRNSRLYRIVFMSLPPSDHSLSKPEPKPVTTPERVQQEQTPAQAVVLSGPQRFLYLCLGFLMLGLGIIGAILPVMPTTIFIILAAWFFARSSPKLEKRILAHPQFGPLVIKWRDRGAIPRRAKKFACGGMMIGYAIFLWSAQPGLYLGAGVALFMLACAYYVVSRPEE